MEIAPALILALAAFTFSFAGFGFSWVALPLLSLVMPMRDAIILHYPIGVALVLYHLWRYRKNLAWRRHWPLVAGAAAGMPLGVWLLLYLPEAGLRKGLAVSVILLVLAISRDWGLRLVERLTSRPWGGAALGLLSGGLQGAYAIGGPPVVLYIMARGKSPEEIKGFLGIYFAFLCLATAGLYGAGGLFSLHWFKLSLYYSPMVLAATMLGAWAFNRVSAGAFRRILLVMLFAASIGLWFNT